jgi:leucyl aminopeptidase
MISMHINQKPMLEQLVDCRVFILEQDFKFDQNLHAIAHAIFPALQELFKERDFTGKLLSTVLVPVSQNGKIIQHLFIGLGKKKAHQKNIDIENYRRALGKTIRIIEDFKSKTVAIQLPLAELFGVSDEYLAQQTAIILPMASYYFDVFITDPARKHTENQQITLVALQAHDSKALQRGLVMGECIADAVNRARNWIDLPPIELTPALLAAKAGEIAKDQKLKITVFTEEEINKMGMGGLSAVSRGSDLDCQLVIMEYKTTRKNAPTVAFVGKGITFDSGGLSIKPALNMEAMKADMAGAAAVIAAMQAIGQLKPEINIIAVTPISENLPSGNAIKPGDIVTFYNGKTAEIKNTDAEGRLILADALSYTVKHYKPDAIIDIATLTGSCAAALGPFFCGMMSVDEPLVAKVNEASARTGERSWRLPLDDDYKPAIRSYVADLCNIGSPKYMAGAITAALFLQNFVNDVPWVHLDIAGVDLDVPDIPYYRPASATGFGVRLLVDIAMHWH